MRKCVFLAVVFSVSLVALACAPSAEPAPTEVPVQPLVVGTSAPPTETNPSTPTTADAPPLPVVAEEPVATSTPVATLSITARDPRLAKPPRPRALLVTQLQQLGNLFATTPANAPGRAQIARTLADSYSELARTAAGTPNVVSAARREAIKNYELIASNYPNDPLIDEVHYYLALEYEMTNELSKSRKAYYDLIRTSPKSKFIPLAYFAFGELFYQEAQTDPSKYDLAEQAYKETLKYPAPGNVVFAEAKQRLVEVAAAKRQITHP
jgi:hypothetical protein